MQNGETQSKPKMCPELPAAVKAGLGGMPQLQGGITCIGELCAKYQACQVMPGKIAELVDLLRERLP